MMQSDDFRLPVHTPASGSIDDKFDRVHDEIGSREHIPWLDSPDEEFGRADDEISSEHAGESHRRALPSIWFLLGMAVLGVLLAFTWRKAPQLWAATRPSVGTQRAVSAEQLEIDTLKETISELRKSQQQMAATIAFLQAAQHELQQKPAYWYSEPNTLMQPTVAAVSPTALPKQKSTARSRPETQGANVARRDHSAPLPLVPARP